MMSPTVFADKLHRYARMKFDHGRKRLIFLRKLMVIIRRPGAWLARRRRGAAAALPENLQQIHTELRDTGFARADAIINPAWLAELQVLADSRIDGVRNAHTTSLSGRKGFWQMIMTDDDLREDSPLVSHALAPSVIETVTAYLGEVPFLSRLELVVSRPSDGSWKVSQLWHRDYNDRHMVKLFSYLSDVGSEAQGPFTFLPADAVKSRGPMFPVHKSDSQMETFSDLDARQQVFGPSGTSFLIDTHRCFHCGSRILDDSYRIAFIATYTTSSPYYAYDNEIRLNDTTPTENHRILQV